MGQWKTRTNIPSDKDLDSADSKLRQLNDPIHRPGSTPEDQKWQLGDITKWNELSDKLWAKYQDTQAELLPFSTAEVKKHIQDNYLPDKSEKKPSDEAISAAARIIARYITAYAVIPPEISTEDPETRKRILDKYKKEASEETRTYYDDYYDGNVAYSGRQDLTWDQYVDKKTAAALRRVGLYYLPPDEMKMLQKAAAKKVPISKAVPGLLDIEIKSLDRVIKRMDCYMSLSAGINEMASPGNVRNFINFVWDKAAFSQKGTIEVIDRLNAQRTFDDRLAKNLKLHFDSDEKVDIYFGYCKDKEVDAKFETNQMERNILLAMKDGSKAFDTVHQVVVKMMDELMVKTQKITAKINHLNDFSLGRKTLDIKLDDI